MVQYHELLADRKYLFIALRVCITLLTLRPLSGECVAWVGLVYIFNHRRQRWHGTLRTGCMDWWQQQQQ